MLSTSLRFCRYTARLALMQEIELQIELELADFVAVCIHGSGGLNRLRSHMVSYGPHAGITAFFATLAFDGTPGFAIALAVAVSLTVYEGGAQLLWRRYLQHLRAHYSAPAQSSFLGPCSIKFSDAGIDIASENERTWRAWENAVKLSDVQEHLFLGLSSGATLILPKRAMASISDVASFITERMPDPKAPQP